MTMPRPLGTLLVGIVTAGVPHGLPAQAGFDSVRIRQVHRVVERESRVRVWAPAHRVELDRPGTTAAGVTGRTRSGTDTTIGFSDVQVVEVRRGHALTGAAIGGVLGVAAGALVGAYIAGWECFDTPPPPYQCRSDQGTAAVGGGFVGLVVMAPLGALAGSAARRWKVVYRQPLPVAFSVRPVSGGLALAVEWRW